MRLDYKVLLKSSP